MGDLYEDLAAATENPDSVLGVQTGYPGIDSRLQGLRA